MGIDYLGPADGNDLKTVELLLKEAVNCNKPVLVHLCTKKGKGFSDAENDPDSFHAVSPNITSSQRDKTTFSEVFGKYIKEEAEKNSQTVVVTAAMCDGTGLHEFREKFPQRFFDVGICEEHAMTFCTAMRAGGFSPYFAVYSTFFQRSWDQLLHDCAIQNLKITLALDRAGFTPRDGATHHGVFDVALLLPVPNLTVYSPSTFDELLYSFENGKHALHSVAVRYPKGTQSVTVKNSFPIPSDISLDEEKSADVLFITYGRITEEVLKAKEILQGKNISCTVLKFLKLKPVDYTAVARIISQINPTYILAVEEGIKIAGFSEHLFANLPVSQYQTDIIAIGDYFVPHGSLDELYDFCAMSSRKICEKVISWKKNS